MYIARLKLTNNDIFRTFSTKTFQTYGQIDFSLSSHSSTVRQADMQTDRQTPTNIFTIKCKQIMTSVSNLCHSASCPARRSKRMNSVWSSSSNDDHQPIIWPLLSYGRCSCYQVCSSCLQIYWTSCLTVWNAHAKLVCNNTIRNTLYLKQMYQMFIMHTLQQW